MGVVLSRVFNERIFGVHLVAHTDPGGVCDILTFDPYLSSWLGFLRDHVDFGSSRRRNHYSNSVVFQSRVCLLPASLSSGSRLIIRLF